MRKSALINRNVKTPAGRTSMRLEPELWEALQDMAHEKQCDIHTLVESIPVTDGGRTSSVRVAIVQHFRDARLAERAHLTAERDARRAGEADHAGCH